MTITLNGSLGITTPDVTSDSYTGALAVNASAPDNSLVVNASGNVGIGTSLPACLLDLAGTALNNSTATNPSTYGIRANLHRSLEIAGSPVSNLNDVRSLGVRSYFNSASSTNAPDSYGVAFAFQHYSGDLGVGSRFITQFANGHQGTPTWYLRNSDTGTGTTFSNWYSINVTNVSDIRAKKNIGDAPSQLPILNQLEVVEFEYTNENEPGVQLGMVAQQVDSVNPYYVTKNTENPDVLWRVNYDKMIPMLVKAIQEQQAIIETQQQAIAGLTARVEALEGAQP